jgi:hypothetical protein
VIQVAGMSFMNRWGQRILFAGYASVCLSLGGCSHDASSKDTYEVPEHIRERQTLRQDPYAEPRPDNAPIDPQFKGFFSIQQPDPPGDTGHRPQQPGGLP